MIRQTTAWIVTLAFVSGLALPVLAQTTQTAPAPAAPAAPAAPSDPAGAGDSGDRTIVSGGQQPWQQPTHTGGEGELPVYEQDGWRWDYAKQEWVPIEQ